MRYLPKGVFEAAREESYFRPVAVLFRKERANIKTEKKKMGGRTSEINFTQVQMRM